MNLTVYRRILASPHVKANVMSLPYILQVAQVGGIRSTSHRAGHQTLHQKRNTEDVHTRIAQSLNLRSIGPCVVGTQLSGDAATEFGTRFVDADPCRPIVLD
jgi:hypothetical protein